MGICYLMQGAQTVALWQPRGMEWGGRWKGGSRGKWHMYSTNSSISHLVMPNSLQPCRLQPIRLLCPWDSSGENIGVGCHFLLQGIVPTQGLNPGLLPCRQILYYLSYRKAHMYTYGWFMLTYDRNQYIIQQISSN